MALQGAFEEHRQVLERMGVETFLIRNLADWHQPKQALIIPGGESTTMTRIMHDLGMWEEVREAIRGGLPVLGTCAGLIMLDPSIWPPWISWPREMPMAGSWEASTPKANSRVWARCR